MRTKIYRSIFKLCRFCARRTNPRYKICSENRTTEPAVYVVHHQNLKGPIVSLIWFDIPVRPWVLSVFCDRKACFHQYYDFTFTKRFGMPKILAAIIAFPLSFCVSGLMPSIRAIPVFRGSKSIIKTIRQSISALIDGESLLICPDIDYKDAGSDMGEMYKGFLDLEKYYFKQTGKHLAFIPLHISKSKRCIYEGEAIYFSKTDDFKVEKDKVYNKLRHEISEMENLA